MYLTKKAKIIIAAGVPAAVIVNSMAAAWAVVAIQEKQVNAVLNDAGLNWYPELVSQAIMNKLVAHKLIRFAPQDYSLAFFVNQIANQPVDQEVIAQIADEDWKAITSRDKASVKSTNDLLFTFKPNANGIKYEIKQIWPERTALASTARAPLHIEAQIDKIYKDRRVTYNTSVSTEGINFVNPDDHATQNQHFLAQAVTRFEELVAQGWLKVQVPGADSTDVNDYGGKLRFSSNHPDLTIVANGGSYKLALNDGNNGPFDFDDQTAVEFSFGDGTVELWDFAKAWPMDATGKLKQENSKAFEFLKENVDKLFIPPNSDQNAELEKYLFNPDLDPFSYFTYNDQNKPVNKMIPMANHAAILVKLSLGSESTYAIIWQNLVQNAYPEIIQNAPEMAYQILPNNRPTVAELKADPDKYLQLVITKDSPLKQGLKYEIIKDTLKVDTVNGTLQADFDVRVSLVDDLNGVFVKTYHQMVTEGIKTDAQAAFDKVVDDLINASTNTDGSLKPITPTGKLNTELAKKPLDAVLEELNGQINDPTTFAKSVELTNKPNGIDYLPESLTTFGAGDLLITYKVVSAKDNSLQSSNYPTVHVVVEHKTTTKP